MTIHRASYLDKGWQVIRSDDGGIHWQPVGPVHAKGKAARALIASIEGDLSPLRSGSEDSGHQSQIRAGEPLSPYRA